MLRRTDGAGSSLESSILSASAPAFRLPPSPILGGRAANFSLRPPSHLRPLLPRLLPRLLSLHFMDLEARWQALAIALRYNTRPPLNILAD